MYQHQRHTLRNHHIIKTQVQSRCKWVSPHFRKSKDVCITTIRTPWQQATGEETQQAGLLSNQVSPKSLETRLATSAVHTSCG